MFPILCISQDLDAAGQELHVASIEHRAAYITWTAGALISWGVAANNRDDTTSPIACGASFFAIGIGWNFSAAQHEKRAGLFLRGYDPGKVEYLMPNILSLR